MNKSEIIKNVLDRSKMQYVERARNEYLLKLKTNDEDGETDKSVYEKILRCLETLLLSDYVISLSEDSIDKFLVRHRETYIDVYKFFLTKEPDEIVSEYVSTFDIESMNKIDVTRNKEVLNFMKNNFPETLEKVLNQESIDLNKLGCMFEHYHKQQVLQSNDLIDFLKWLRSERIMGEVQNEEVIKRYLYSLEKSEEQLEPTRSAEEALVDLVDLKDTRVKDKVISTTVDENEQVPIDDLIFALNAVKSSQNATNVSFVIRGNKIDICRSTERHLNSKELKERIKTITNSIR